MNRMRLGLKTNDDYQQSGQSPHRITKHTSPVVSLVLVSPYHDVCRLSFLQLVLPLVDYNLALRLSAAGATPVPPLLQQDLGKR